MAKNFLQEGNRIDVPVNTITKAVTSGELYAIGEMHGVCLHTRGANETNVLGIGRVWNLAKITGAGTAGAMGAIAYAKDDGGILKATGEVAANKPIGVFVASAADGDAVAQVKLREVPT